MSDSVPEGGVLDYHDEKGSVGVVDFTDGAPAQNSVAPPATPGSPSQPGNPAQPNQPTVTDANGSVIPSQPTGNATLVDPATNEPIPAGDEPQGEGSPTFRLPEGVEYTQILKYHAFIMLFAWILCPFAGYL